MNGIVFLFGPTTNKFGNGHDNTKTCGAFCGQGNQLKMKPWLQSP